MKKRMSHNMGAITRKEIEEFAELVLEDFLGWRFSWSAASPSICDKEQEIIWIAKRYIGRYPWEAKENVLHETAHINTWPSDSFHGEEFYREYIRLLQIHMAGGGGKSGEGC